MDKISFNDLLQKSGGWRNRKLLPFMKPGFEVSCMDGDQLVVLDKELEMVHPDLPAGIHFIAEDAGVAATLDIRNMLKIWSASVCIETWDGARAALFEVFHLQVDHEMVQFTADGINYIEQVSPKTGNIIRIPDERGAGRFTVYRDWLTQEYPDWESKMQIAQSLDLPASEVVDFMLSETFKSASPTIPDDLALE